MANKAEHEDIPTGLVGYENASAITGLPVGSLYSLVSKKAIPHVRYGKRCVRFDPVALRSWIDAHRVTGAAH